MDLSIIPEEYFFIGLTYSTFTEQYNYNNSDYLKLVCDKYKDDIHYVEMPNIVLYKINEEKELESSHFTLQNYLFSDINGVYDFIDEYLKLYKLYIYNISTIVNFNQTLQLSLRMYIKGCKVGYRNIIISEILDL